MPIIRTKFRPWEDQEVTDEEAASMERMGLLSNIVLGVATIIAEAEPDPAPVAEAEPGADVSSSTSGRRAKTAPVAPAEEVKTDGSSEEGGSQEAVPEEG